ncbi:anaphase-promoting complex subunit 16-like [Mya arenaria]|uniref:anaphase-promoting complex subunit 16-like n=1 Tax=Mya arenaria TaxID=6604 RepID=UPI0022E231A0|nr:anaphase-promoting complex subunit 16-like [Mya arenaria]
MSECEREIADARKAITSFLGMNSFKEVDVRKALFSSPGIQGSEEDQKNTAALNVRLEIEHDTEEQLKKTQKEAHEKRMKKFRQMAKQLGEDDWLYPPVEKLIGLK